MKIKTNFSNKMKILLLSITVISVIFGKNEIPIETHGTVINYSAPSSEKYIGSPSIVILPNGDYVATHDYFGKGSTNNKTVLFSSKDKGEIWEKLTVLNGQWWSTLFINNGSLFLIGTSKEYGNIVIRKSDDNGKTWSIPENKQTGLLLSEGQYHCSSVPVVIHNNRIWRAFENRNPPKGWGDTFCAFVMSAPIDSDLLNAKNWTTSNQLRYEKYWAGGGWLEGNVVVSSEGKLLNILRNHTEKGGKAAVIKISKNGKKISFDPKTGFIDFPGGSKKFTIRYDEVSKLYWSLSNYVPQRHQNEIAEQTRNTLALISSPDLEKWTVNSIVLYHPDAKKIGFQYADWQFENDDIVCVSRTAYSDKDGGAKNSHDANYFTFHRIKNFRSNHFAYNKRLQALLPIEDRVELLVSQMTLEEKIDQLNGEIFSTNGNKRLGIPKIIIYDGESETKANRKTVNFSANMNWAASFDEDLIHRIGLSMGEEARVLGSNMLLNPCVNIMRTPFNGRAYEAFGEDPYLVSRLATAYVKGAQSHKVITSTKHYIANNQDWNRFDVNIEMDERTLREIYLPAYKTIVQEGNGWSLMSAYNMFRGDWCSENKYILNDILRDEWGFDGFVVSDWGGTHSTAKMANAGLDLEMPKALWFGEKLLDAVKSGKVSEETIDDRVRNMLRIMFRAGLFDEQVNAYGGELKTKERIDLALETAHKSIVLLKNEKNILPLDKNKIKSIAVLGPNGNVARVAGSGSGEYHGYFQVSPLDGIINKAGDKIDVKFERGIPEMSLELPIAGIEYYEQPNGEPGLHAEYFNNKELKGEPVYVTTEKSINFDWGFGPIVPASGPGSPKPGVVNHDKWSARWTGKLISPGEGFYEIGIQADNGVKVFLNNELLIDSWTDEAPGKFKVTKFKFDKNVKYDLKVEFYENIGSCRCKMGIAPFKPNTSDQKAVDLARNSDFVVMCMGLFSEMEGEQLDRDELSLPKEQIDLIKMVTEVNKNCIVVLNNGTPLIMSEWIDDVPAIVEAFYPGQDGGNAVADILFGKVNPSGKLPVTFTKKWEDHSAYGTYPGKKELAEYTEGIYVGYRHFDKNKIEPLFPFGYGLSYTTFEYSDIKLSSKSMKQNDVMEVSFAVKNTGKMDGDEVVQLYIHDKKASVDREVKSLKGFKRVSLKSGERKTVTMKIDKSDLAFYDVKTKKWIAESGIFEVLIGASSRDIRLKNRFNLK